MDTKLVIKDSGLLLDEWLLSTGKCKSCSCYCFTYQELKDFAEDLVFNRTKVKVRWLTWEEAVDYVNAGGTVQFEKWNINVLFVENGDFMVGDAKHRDPFVLNQEHFSGKWRIID